MSNKSSVALLTVEIKVLKKPCKPLLFIIREFFRHRLLCHVEHVCKDIWLPYLSRRTHNTHNKLVMGDTGLYRETAIRYDTFQSIVSHVSYRPLEYRIVYRIARFADFLDDMIRIAWPFIPLVAATCV